MPADDYDDPSDIDEIGEYLSDADEYDGDPPGYEEPPLDQTWDCVITVDNLPKVPKAKEAKLTGVIKKIFGQMGAIVRTEMPFDSADVSLGFAFIEFESGEQAAKAVQLTDGYALDKAHVFKVAHYQQVKRIADMPDEYVKPEFRPYEERAVHAWLEDPAYRDQFVVRHDEDTAVYWLEGRAHVPPALVYGGEREKGTGVNWCERYVAWSSQGTYLATFHNKGIAIWAGDAFEKIGRYAHKGVKAVIFSPGEKYVVTCNFLDGDPRAFVVWDVKSGRELRNFALTKTEGGQPHAFKWSHDDQFLARAGKDKTGGDVVSVYTLPSMQLLDKKSLRTDGAREFQWSPAANTIAYWAPECGNSPARVTLVEIPSRKELRQKNLFHVSECNIHWQAQGAYMCVKVLRHTKSKKTLFNNFEVFRVNEKMIPVEALEIKEQVLAFAWEPTGDRFAITHGEGSRPSVSIYTMSGKAAGGGVELSLVKTLESRACNVLYWSPAGGMLLLATLGESSGALEFYDADHDVSKVEEHYKMTHIEWDPSGRTLCTAVCQPLDGAFFKFQMDNGYKIWTWQGELLNDVGKEAFYQFSWRPRPKSLLSEEARAKIVKNLRKYERQFGRADMMKQKEREYHLTVEKRKERKIFRDRLAAADARRKRVRDLRYPVLRKGFDENDDANFEITKSTSESCVSMTEELLD